MVDDILVKGIWGQKYYQVGPKLDEFLLNFYLQKLGRDKEMYAIALYDEPTTEPNLVKIINELLKSSECKKKLEELREKWIK